MVRYEAENRVQSADSECCVLGDGQSLMAGRIGLQNDVAANLMDDPVIPPPAEVLDQSASGQIPRKLHASSQGEALVANQVKPHSGGEFLR